MSREPLVFGNGTVQFSREKLAFHADSGPVLHARSVTETAPNGGVYMRLATAIEDELLDALVEDEAADRPLDAEQLARAWEDSAASLGRRVFDGDPSATLATIRTLENCAAELRAALSSSGEDR